MNNFQWMWDITMYMLELTINFRDPNSNFPIATGNSCHTSLTRKSPAERVEEVVAIGQRHGAADGKRRCRCFGACHRRTAHRAERGDFRLQGVSFTSKIEMGWTLKRADTGGLEAFSGAERAKMSLTGAIKNNISAGLSRLATLSL